jgi:predicted dinucleotide-binding enzyme
LPVLVSAVVCPQIGKSATSNRYAPTGIELQIINMKIGILGTGMVGEALGTKFTQLGHDVRMGSRTANNESAAKWVKAAGSKVSQGTFEDAAGFGEMVFICLKGTGFLDVAKTLKPGVLAGKILVDVSNPLDFSKGMPPSLSICNTNSLGEEVQKAVPSARIVKTLNIVNCDVMIDPTKGGNPTMLLCGNDAEAKSEVTGLLKDMGWRDIIDLGDITKSRGTEMLLPLWLNLFGLFGNPGFGFKVVRG